MPGTRRTQDVLEVAELLLPVVARGREAAGTSGVTVLDLEHPLAHVLVVCVRGRFAQRREALGEAVPGERLCCWIYHCSTTSPLGTGWSTDQPGRTSIERSRRASRLRRFFSFSRWWNAFKRAWALASAARTRRRTVRASFLPRFC